MNTSLSKNKITAKMEKILKTESYNNHENLFDDPLNRLKLNGSSPNIFLGDVHLVKSRLPSKHSFIEENKS